MQNNFNNSIINDNNYNHNNKPFSSKSIPNTFQPSEKQQFSSATQQPP